MKTHIRLMKTSAVAVAVVALLVAGALWEVRRVHATSRLGASKSVIDGYGAVRRQNV